MPESTSPISTEDLLRLVLDNMPIRVFWKDVNSIFLGANQHLLGDVGLSDISDLVGKSDFDLRFSQEQAENFRQHDKEVMDTRQAKINIEEPMTQEDDSVAWLRTNKVPLIDKHNKVVGVLGSYEDITEQIQYRQTIERQALIDQLTQLPNRRKLQNVIEDWQGTTAGLLFIDLDHFKTINDSLGHSIGDDLLEQVAQRLKNVFCEHEDRLVARLGGDEFSVFMPIDTVSHKQQSLEQAAQAIIDSLTQPFYIEEHILSIGASIGVAFHENACDGGASAWFREADMAMYMAKANGRNQYRFYDSQMQAAALRQHLIRSNLAKAIESNELHLVFQPQLDVDNKLLGAEALLRWQSQELGFVAPDEFITVAEETGFIHTLGLWVFTHALDILQSWGSLTRHNPSFKMAINFSVKQLQNPGIVDLLEQEIAKRSIDPTHIQIEITESLFIDDHELVRSSVVKLQQLGISIAIDDFGTGYSSLSHLANLPIDKLKIDRSFVTDLHDQHTNQKLIDTMVSMSKNLNMEVIAEGVETEEELNALIMAGCRQYQGYLFSRPILPDDLLAKYSV